MAASAPDEADLLGLLERLYGGLTEAPPWDAFLRALGEATGATFATLLIGRGAAAIDAHVTPGADPGRTREYSQGMALTDPFVGLPEGEVISFRDFVRHVPERFREWMDSSRTGQILGVDIHREPETYVRLRLTRDSSRADFTEREVALVARLVPHLRIALNLHARLTTTQAESQLFSSAMADLAVATLILGRDGRILRRNATAAHMLESGTMIEERSGRLEPRTQSGAGAIARVLAAPPPAGEECQFEVAIPNGPPLRARARAVPSSDFGDGAWIALFLADPQQRAGPSEDALRDRFQLTRAEAALASRLIAGEALPDAAQALEIAYNTARSHLRAIFSKTGTHRQAQLVMLLRSPPGGADN